MSHIDVPRRRRAIVGATAAITAVATIAALGLLTAVTSSPSGATTSAETVVAPDGSVILGPSATASPASLSPATGSLADVKNVVFILADDLDWELFNEIPRLAALQDQGMTFTHHVVTDSLCCPSRTSILRSQYIHNHLVVSNTSATGGGWPTFKARGEDNDCLPVWLQNAGVTTALFGKFMNDYPATTATTIREVPPGWTKWAVPVSRGESYTGYDYVLNSDGQLERHGSKPTDFLNDVITNRAVDFISTAPDGFFLELSTYNPHKPSPVATRNKDTHADTVAPRTASYNVAGTNAPTWMRKLKPLSSWKQWQLDQLWRQRAQSAESVADSVEAVMTELRATGHDDDTLVVLTSDNGYHAGAHGLANGKRTAFHEDTVVPMVIMGPGVSPGARVDALTSTVDLGPTFTELLGAQAPDWVDGRSLVPILQTSVAPQGWRTAALSESMGLSTPVDPDYQAEAPPSFSAMRTQQYLFVVYRDGERELYDLAADPNEMNNIASTADPILVTNLNSQLQAMRSCSGASCRTADSMVISTGAP